MSHNGIFIFTACCFTALIIYLYYTGSEPKPETKPEPPHCNSSEEINQFYYTKTICTKDTDTEYITLDNVPLDVYEAEVLVTTNRGFDRYEIYPTYEHIIGNKEGTLKLKIDPNSIKTILKCRRQANYPAVKNGPRKGECVEDTWTLNTSKATYDVTGYLPLEITVTILQCGDDTTYQMNSKGGTTVHLTKEKFDKLAPYLYQTKRGNLWNPYYRVHYLDIKKEN